MELCNSQLVLGRLETSTPSDGETPRDPLTLFHLAGSLGSLSLPGTALPRHNSKADECTEWLSFPFAECAEQLGFSFVLEAQDGVSRPLVGLLDAQLLAACYRPRLAKTEIKASIHHPRRHAAGRHANGWLAATENLFGTISPTRPAERTGRLRVCAATELCCCRRPSFMLEAQLFAGQAVASANTRTVAELAALPTRGSSEGRGLRRLCLCLRVFRS